MITVRLEWGLAGALHAAEGVAAAVVIDVLSFSTAVSVALERGATVWPHPSPSGAAERAGELDAVLAGPRVLDGPPSLSPASLLALEPGARLLLTSPNGGRISHALHAHPCAVFVAGLRNAVAVADGVLAACAERTAGRDPVVLLVPAGERWPDGSMRVAYEDLIGAGALASALVNADPLVRLSPEAEAADAAYRSRRPLSETASGQELLARGFAADVELAEQVGAGGVVPLLVDGALRDQSARP